MRELVARDQIIDLAVQIVALRLKVDHRLCERPVAQEHAAIPDLLIIGAQSLPEGNPHIRWQLLIRPGLKTWVDVYSLIR